VIELPQAAFLPSYRLTVVVIATRRETPIALPPGGCAEGFSWAPDGATFAFRDTSPDAVELWVGDRDGHLVATLHPLARRDPRHTPPSRPWGQAYVPEIHANGDEGGLEVKN